MTPTVREGAGAEGLRQGVSIWGPCFIRNQVGGMGKLLPLASSFLTVTHGIMFIFFGGGT